MLANGKEVNYLMINGEVFGAKNNLPRYYRFGKNSEVYQSELSYNADNKADFYIPQYSNEICLLKLLAPSKTLVAQLVKDVNSDIYALVFCKLTYKYTGPNSYSDREYNGWSWIRPIDFGGCTPLEKMGGVNSPSYLLFIYNIREVTPYVG